jgi:hypothetical protein
MWTRHAAGLALGAAAATMGGCWSTPTPTLSVAGVRAGDRTADGSLIEIEVEATSTADEALPLTEVEYVLTLEGREVFRGVRSPEATIRRFGVQRLVLPAVVPGGVTVSGAYSVRGTLTYIEPGTITEVLFDLGVRTPTVDFAGSGTVSATEPSGSSR